MEQRPRNPLQDAAQYEALRIGGVASPGLMTVVSGCERKTVWDIKQSGGEDGGTITHKGKHPPERHKLKFTLWTIPHFNEWAEWVKLLDYDPDKRKDKALQVDNPILADAGIKAIVVSSIGPLTHEGAGRFSYTVTFINYRPPVPVTTKTPTGTSGKFIEKNVPAPTAQSAQEKEIARLLDQIKNEKP